MTYTVTLTRCGLEQARYRERSWRAACSVAHLLASDVMREMQPKYANGTDRLRASFGCAQAIERFFSGADWGYRLPKPVLPGSTMRCDFGAYTLTIERKANR